MPNGASSRPARSVLAVADLADDSAQLVVGGLVGDGPAVAEIGPAVVDEGHRHAVAEVVGRERDQPRVAEVEHAVVADLVGRQQRRLDELDEARARA